MRARTQRDNYRHSCPHHEHGPAMGLLNQRRYNRQAPAKVGQGERASFSLRRALGHALCVLAVLVTFFVAVASADAPTQVETPTPTPKESGGLLPLAQATTVDQQATITPTLEATSTPTLEATSTPTPVTAIPEPTRAPPTPSLSDPTPSLSDPTPSPSDPTPSGPLSGTAHLAIRVSDCVVSVGGTASSEVFMFLQNVEPGVVGFHLSLYFDPQIVHIVDADGNAANGIQIAPAAFSSEPQTVTENQADNAAGRISLTVMQNGGAPVHGTPSWHKIATLAWIGQREGNSVVTIGIDSHFIAPDGQQFAPDAAHNGTVFSRSPGQLVGTVRLPGREGAINALVTGSLAAGRTDQVHTAPDGRFVLVTSHGEGFYTLAASASGYLSAEGHRPVRITMGSVIDLGEVTLYGGDATGDDRIDIRDLSFVAWHFGDSNAQADINGDGQVDILDLSLTAGNFGRVGPTVWQVPAAQ